MSNTAMAAIIMAMVLALASVNAQATNGGLSAAQIRALIKKEVAQIPRVRGPAGPRGAQGPAGPAGMDGFPSLFAHVFGTGIVDDSVPGGITQENVQRVDMEFSDENGQMILDTTYCLSGLPPVSGGQVTIDGNGRSAELGSPNIDMETQDPECPIRVSIAGPNSFRRAANFYILLY